MDELALVLDDGELVSLGCIDGTTAPGGRQSPEPVAAD
jgi:hypothetical protein